MPVVDGLPVPVGGRQVPPRTPGARPPQHPVDHRPMIRPPTTPTRCRVRQQRLHPGPLLVAQIMPIMHTRCLPHPSPEIRGTRPSLPRMRLATTDSGIWLSELLATLSLSADLGRG